MTQEDARFEDAQETPLALKAGDAEDLAIIATLTQDAVIPATEIAWKSSENRFAMLINRFRWEDKAAAERQGRAFERVQAVLVFDTVLKVASNGVDIADKDQIFSLLDVTFKDEGDLSGIITLQLAGDGEIALHVECIDATLKDVTRPYVAPSKKSPQHDLS